VKFVNILALFLILGLTTCKEKTRDDQSITSPQIKISNRLQALKKRRKIASYIWQHRSFPERHRRSYLKRIKKNFQNNDFKNLAHLRQTDKLVFRLGQRILSTAFLLHPKTKSNTFVIYIHGPNNSWNNETDPLISALLEKGHRVLVYYKALKGGDSTVRLLLNAVARGVNYLRAVYRADNIAMIGFSEGGWITAVYSALDERVKNSYLIADIFSSKIRKEQVGWEYYEQMLPQFHRIITYPELYVLGSYGNNRRQLQIVSKCESCGFSGIDPEDYQGAVKSTLKQLGQGIFNVFLDEIHTGNDISPAAVRKIINDLEI